MSCKAEMKACFVITLYKCQDEEIKKYVKQILEGANLEQITMKTVCKQVYSHYPDFDLAHKKDFIKATVKSVSKHYTTLHYLMSI